MSAGSKAKRPIIVKRHAKHEESHGGQWKVAYADFVTAMMAFFLVMWLLSTATQNEREVIARYFTSTSVFNLPAGNGVLPGGKSMMTGGEARAERVTGAGKLAKGTNQDGTSQAPQPSRDRLERQRFEALKAEVEQSLRGGALANLSNHVMVEMTSEGLRLQIFDRDGEPMFQSGSVQPTPRLLAVLHVIADMLGTVDNPVVLTGHTDSAPLQRGNYSNWELSADRANAARRALEADGLPRSRFLIVEGRAATQNLFPDTPTDPRNRRIAVTILRRDVAATVRGAVPPPTSGPASSP